MSDNNKILRSSGQIIRIPNLKATWLQLQHIEFNKKHHLPEIIQTILSYLDDIDVWCCFVLKSRTWHNQAQKVLQLRCDNIKHLDCRNFTVFDFTRFTRILQFNQEWFSNYITKITLNQRPKHLPRYINMSSQTLQNDSLDKAVLSLIQLSDKITICYGPVKLTLHGVTTVNSVNDLLRYRLDDQSVADLNDYKNHSNNIKPLLPNANHLSQLMEHRRLDQLLAIRIPGVYNCIHNIIENISGLYSLQALELDCGIDIRSMLTIPLHFYKHLRKLQLKIFNATTPTLQQFILKLAEHSTLLDSLALLVDTSSCDDADQVLAYLLRERRDTLHSLQLVDWTFKDGDFRLKLEVLQHLDIRLCHGTIQNIIQQLQLPNLQLFSFSIHPLEIDNDILEMVIKSDSLVDIVEVYSNIANANTRYFDDIYKKHGYVCSGRVLKIREHFTLQLYCNKWCKTF